jgi:hydrogenase maturation protein HypF
MTSANSSGGPVIIDDESALNQLGTLVDAVLTHDREILHHADDSVVRLCDQDRIILRLGRGLAPCVIPCRGPSGILALGGHQKNSFAMTNQNKIFVSQDMGRLDDYQNIQRYESEIKSLFELMNLQPVCALHDQHPDYGSTRLAPVLHRKTHGIQHHEAHVLASVIDQETMDAGLALGWDGWGLGTDGALWGGEFYDVKPRGEGLELQRIGSLLPFPIAGGDRAAREPWRCALGVAHAMFGKTAYENLEHYGAAGCLREKGAEIIGAFLGQGLASLQCSSVGRIFDAVASFLDIRQLCTFEGQAAMLLEGRVDEALAFDPYPVAVQREGGLHIVDWRPGIAALLFDVKHGLSHPYIAAKFHQMWVQAVLMIVVQTGHERVFLSGGVFQNVYLQACLRKQLQQKNISVHSPKGLPLHDGNLAAGQVHWALLQGIQ